MSAVWARLNAVAHLCSTGCLLARFSWGRRIHSEGVCFTHMPAKTVFAVCWPQSYLELSGKNIRPPCGLSVRLGIIGLLTEYPKQRLWGLLKSLGESWHCIKFATFYCVKLVRGLVQTQREETTHCINNGRFCLSGPLMKMIVKIT